MITLLCTILNQIHQEVLIFYIATEKSKLLDGLSVNDGVKVKILLKNGPLLVINI